MLQPTIGGAMSRTRIDEILSALARSVLGISTAAADRAAALSAFAASSGAFESAAAR